MDDTLTRPTNSCLTCPPPRKVGHWRPADPGYRTCSDCYDKLREDLQDITRRYLLLDPTPGASSEAGGRGAPGFGSRPSASPHVIVMTDWRSKSCEVATDGVQYVWDPLADDTLEPGQYGPPGGAFTGKREVWYGRDGRGHTEQENPARSVPATLAALAGLVAEERDTTPPATRTVHELTRWLDNNMDWITRQDLVTDFRDDLRALVKQLMPVTGDPGRRSIGLCPNVIDEGTVTRECRTRLYAQLKGDNVTCTVCERRWEGDELLRLGDLLVAS